MVLLKFYTFEVKPQVAADRTDPVFFFFIAVDFIFFLFPTKANKLFKPLFYPKTIHQAYTLVPSDTY